MPHLVQQNNYQEAERSQCCPGFGCCFVGDGGFESMFEEVVHSGAGKVSCDATLTTWGIPGAKRLRSGNTDSSHFTRVNCSGVIASRCGRCNCVDNLVINLNGHAVASLNGFNFMPANGMFAEHIGDDDSFIEENNLRFQEKYVGTQSNCCADGKNFDDSLSVRNDEIVNDNAKAQENAEAKKHKVTSRAVNQCITHSRIITYKSNQGSEEALA